MGRFRKRIPYHFGIDTMKAYVDKDPFKASKLDGLSSNSDVWKYDRETTVYFVSTLSGKKFGKYFEIVDDTTRVRLGFVLFGKENEIGAVDRRHRFEVTGQGFILRNMGWYLKFLEVCNLYITGFKRVDLALDVKLDTDYCIRNVFLPEALHFKKSFEPVVKRGVYETLYIGNRDPKENTWKLIRIYNKIIDTKKKDKAFLYDMESMGSELTRIELELRRDKAKYFKVEYLQDTERLFDIFGHEVFEINKQFFKHIHSEDIVKLKNSYFIDVFRDENGNLFKGLNLTEGVSKAFLEEKTKRFIQFGNEFKSDKSSDKAIATVRTYYKKLRISNRITYDGFMELINEIEKEIDSHNEEHGLVLN